MCPGRRGYDNGLRFFVGVGNIFAQEGTACAPTAATMTMDRGSRWTWKKVRARLDFVCPDRRGFDNGFRFLVGFGNM